jgi:hypothetical protein
MWASNGVRRGSHTGTIHRESWPTAHLDGDAMDHALCSVPDSSTSCLQIRWGEKKDPRTERSPRPQIVRPGGRMSDPPWEKRQNVPLSPLRPSNHNRHLDDSTRPLLYKPFYVTTQAEITSGSGHNSSRAAIDTETRRGSPPLERICPASRPGTVLRRRLTLW